MFILTTKIKSVRSEQITVYNQEDNVIGSLRWAILLAANSRNPTSIIVSPSIPLIKLNSPLIYKSVSPLAITVMGNTFIDAAKDTFISVENCINFNLMNIRTNGAINYSGGDIQSVKVINLTNCSVFYTRHSGLFIRDSRVNDLIVNLNNVLFYMNKMRGISILKSRGNLICNMNLVGVMFNGAIGNSDNTQLCQTGEGDVRVNIQNYYSIGANEDSLEVEESDAGGIFGFFTNVFSFVPGEEGIEVSERGDGEVVVYLNNVHNLGFNPLDEDRNDGIEIRARDKGDLFAKFTNCSSSYARMDGVRIIPDENAQATAIFDNCIISNNQDDGIDFDSSMITKHTGKSTLIVRNSRIFNNFNNGIKAVSPPPNTGLLRLEKTRIYDNGDNIDLEGTKWRKVRL